jgi:hypothetical protein
MDSSKCRKPAEEAKESATAEFYSRKLDMKCTHRVEEEHLLNNWVKSGLMGLSVALPGGQRRKLRLRVCGELLKRSWSKWRTLRLRTGHCKEPAYMKSAVLRQTHHKTHGCAYIKNTGTTPSSLGSKATLRHPTPK